MRLAWIGAALVSGVGCAGSALPRQTTNEPILATAKAAVAARKADAPKSPYTERVAVRMTFPRGPTFEGRGAVAVDPGRAMRMILVGPGGATAIDAWVGSERWRIAIPPADRLERGTTGAAGTTKLPVDFFRFWFLRRYEGRVSYADRAHVILTDGDARTTFDAGIYDRAGTYTAVRRVGAASSTITFEPGPPSDAAADDHASSHATFVDGTGVRVAVTVLGRESDAPDPAAFVDPDHDVPDAGSGSAAGGSP
ncbi:MAG: hypothetical protein U0169_14090 [Polyangiaceae bacterium]